MASLPAPLQVQVDASALQAAVESLEELAKRSPEAVQAFLDSGDPLAQCIGVDTEEELAAVRAGYLRIGLEPSEGLAEFLASARIGVCPIHGI